MSRRAIVPSAVALVAASLSLGLAGCGDPGDSQATPDAPVARNAAGAGFTPDTKTCPERNGSWTSKPVVWNYLPYDIVIRAGDYTCSDWSGVSTPGRTFNAVTVRPMQAFYGTLEPRDNVRRSWTMQVSRADTGEQLGTFRIAIPVVSTPIDQGYALGGASTTRYVNTVKTQYQPLDAAAQYETGDYYWSKETNEITILGYKGRVTVVVAPWEGGL